MNLTSCEFHVYNNTDVYNKLQKFQYIYMRVSHMKTLNILKFSCDSLVPLHRQGKDIA